MLSTLFQRESFFKRIQILAKMMRAERKVDTTEIAKIILEELMLHDINQNLQIVNSEELNPTESIKDIL